MRAGGCTVQQALTAEAAGVVKQAVSLARRRGNAQVTPLHVASAMLAPPSGLLRAACLRCHSHPLQCKALELCFNVALNRLPTSSAASPLLGGHHHHYCPPSLSNALVAAFKRAQAHQRRGTVESQQQPVLAVKIELEQLVISILDDPSVSRVMREAGFSSTQVKANVEHAMSSMEGHPCSTITTTTTTANRQNPNPTTTTSPTQETKAKLSSGHGREEDATAVLDCLAARSKRRIVVVAECAATTEAAVQAAVERIKGGEAQHEALRGAQLVSLSVSSFRDLPREEAERRLAELRRVVRGSGSLLLVVEDLSWAAEFWAENVERGRRSYYCAVEHVVTEVRALACGGDGLWIVGFGTYQTYMRCRAGQPSLESLWGLQTLTVPAGSLALSLNLVDDSAFVVNQSLKANCGRNGNGNGMTSGWSLFDGSGAAGSQLIATCCGDCSATEKLEPKALMSRPVVSSSSLPSWLQCCRDQEPSHLTDLCKKWSSICSPPSHVMTLNFSTAASPSSSVSSYEHHLHQPWLLADLDAKQPRKAKCQLGAQVNSHDSGASNGSVEVECRSKFKELNAENLKRLCGALEKAVPWQKEIVPEIASTVLRCRSGMAKRRGKSRSTDAREETWLFFLGGDSDGKEKVARELAGLVFGSRKNFLSIGLDSSSPSRSGSTEEHRHKRPRTETSQAYLQRLYEEVSEKPDRVILLEDVEQADRHCRQGIKDAIDSGTVRSRDGDEVGLRDAIVILSCESFDESSRACSPPSKNTKPEAEEVAEEEDTSGHKKPGPSSCFDLNQNAENEAEECCSGDVDLLNAVDRTLFFRIPDEL